MTPYYSDDAVVIYHGEALEVLDQLDPVDAVVTDPPFFMPAQHYSSRTAWARSWGDTTILGSWWGMVLDMLPLADHASVLSFCDGESYPVFYPQMYTRFPVVRSLVWDKGSIGMGRPWRHQFELVVVGRTLDSKWTSHGGHSDIIGCKTIPSRQRVHPVDKPTDLLRELLTPVTDPGDVVLDPFMGGGSTLRAAKDCGRRAIGIELDEHYCEVAANRMTQEVLAL